MSPIPKPNVRMPAAPAGSRPAPPQPIREGSQNAPISAETEHFVSPHGDEMRGVPIVLALGSNLGDRERTLADAVRAIAELDGIELTGVSAVFESAAVKLTGVDHNAPAYLNMVVAARYQGESAALLDAVNGIENDHGRIRTERWGDRTLDIDIVSFGDIVQDDERLTLPHPRAAERDFVLAPWLQLDPEAVLPGRGRVADLLGAIENTVVVHPSPTRSVAPPHGAPLAPKSGGGR